MALPGFTAGDSVYRSRRQYRTASTAPGFTADGGVLPQQDEPGSGTVRAHCCGQYCHGLCICMGGNPQCMPSLEAEDALPTILRATDGVAMALDSCHADQPVDGGYAFVVCPCGCWATTHDAACMPCHAALREPATFLKG